MDIKISLDDTTLPIWSRELDPPPAHFVWAVSQILAKTFIYNIEGLDESLLQPETWDLRSSCDGLAINIHDTTNYNPYEVTIEDKIRFVKRLSVDRKRIHEIRGLPQHAPEWFAERRFRLTGSILGSACGVNPYETPTQLLVNKVWPELQRAEIAANPYAVNFGTISEDYASQCSRTVLSSAFATAGAKCVHITDLGLQVSEEYPMFGTSSDGEIAVHWNETEWAHSQERTRRLSQAMTNARQKAKEEHRVLTSEEMDAVRASVLAGFETPLLPKHLQDAPTKPRGVYSLADRYCGNFDSLYVPEWLGGSSCNNEGEPFFRLHLEIKTPFGYRDAHRPEDKYEPVLDSTWGDPDFAYGRRSGNRYTGYTKYGIPQYYWYQIQASMALILNEDYSRYSEQYLFWVYCEDQVHYMIIDFDEAEWTNEQLPAMQRFYWERLLDGFIWRHRGLLTCGEVSPTVSMDVDGEQSISCADATRTQISHIDQLRVCAERLS